MKIRNLIVSLLIVCSVQAAVFDTLLVRSNAVINGTLNGVNVNSIVTNSAANKLNITNGTAVNLTGTVNDITINGTSIYDGDDQAVISAGTSFNYALRGDTSGAITMGPLAHTTTSIATLQAISTDTMTTNATIEVRGYYSAGDGGGGTFYYAPFEATNRGMVFLSGNASFVWKRLVEGPAVDIRWFGARSNGFVTNEVYDSTVAIEAAVDYANANGASVFVPEGEWISSGGHELDGVRMYGIKSMNRFGVGGPNPFNTNATAVLRHKIGATNDMLRLLRGAELDKVVLMGRRWYNYPTPKTITASTSTTFTVSTNDLPADPASTTTYPYFGAAMIFTPDNIPVGMTLLTDIDQATGVCTFNPTFDYFMTATNNDNTLPAGWKVVLSPTANLLNPRDNTYTTNFIDPTRAGYNGIVVDGDHCRISDVTVYGFHVNVRIGNNYVTRITGLDSQGAGFAHIAKTHPSYGFDTYASDLLLQGQYLDDLYNPQTDGAFSSVIGTRGVGTNIFDSAARVTPFGIVAPSNSDRYDNWTIDPNITGILFGSPNTVRLGSGLIDSVYHHGIFGFYGNSSPTTFSATELKIRSSIAASPSAPPFQLARPARWSNPTAILVEAPTATVFDFGILDLPDLGLGGGQRFASGLYFQPGGTGTRRVAVLGSTQGVTNLLNGSSDGVTFGIGHNGSFDVTLDDLTATNSVTAATVTATSAATVGTSANGLSLTVNGGTSGTGMLRLVRDGVGTNSIGIGTRALSLREDTQNRTFALFDTDGSTLNRLTFGGGATATPRDAYLAGEDASGSNQAGKILYVRAGAGTGNSTSGGSITFQTPDATSSGSTLQSHTGKVTIQRDGDIAIGNTAQIEFGTRAALSSPATGVVSVEGNVVPSPASPSTGNVPVWTNSTWVALPIVSSGVLTAPSAEFIDHFLQRQDGGTKFLGDIWPGTGGAGGGVNYQAAADTGGHPGIAALNTGTTSSANAYLTTAADGLLLGYGATEFECAFYFSALSDATDTFTFHAGFFDGFGTTSVVDGAFVRYSHGVNSGKFQFVTSANSTQSTGDTAVTVAAATWYRIRVAVNAAGTSATATVMNGSGTVLGTSTITSNIPTTSGRQCGNGTQVVRSAGTASRNTFVDWHRLKLEPTP